MTDENCKSLASKMRVICGRLVLIHHGLKLAVGKVANYKLPVELVSVEAGIAWGRWCIEEQMRVYGFASSEFIKEKGLYLLGRIHKKYGDTQKVLSIRAIIQTNNYKYKSRTEAIEAMEVMVQGGHARWTDDTKKAIKMVGISK
jgi:hypothetical protein